MNFKATDSKKSILIKMFRNQPHISPGRLMTEELEAPHHLWMTKKKENKPQRILKIAGAGEIAMPKSDPLNIWDHDFGWVLRHGRPTENTKAYWQAMRRRPKQ
jgi:hypothetical protein